MTKKISSTVITFILLGLAAALLIFSTIGGAKAALDEEATLRLSMMTKTMDLVMKENGNPIGDDGTILGNLSEEGMTPGKPYEESITVTNTGKITAYVRISIYKYWASDNGKDVTLSPELIKVIPGESGWVVDSEYSTPERMVLYYTSPLEPGAETDSAISSIMLDSKIMDEVRQEVSADGRTITTIYEYDGLSFGFEAEVDGVQARSGQDAIMQEWGRAVTIGADGSLSF